MDDWKEVFKRQVITVRGFWIKELKAKKVMLMKKPSDNKKEWNEIFGLILRAIEIKK